MVEWVLVKKNVKQSLVQILVDDDEMTILTFFLKRPWHSGWASRKIQNIKIQYTF